MNNYITNPLEGGGMMNQNIKHSILAMRQQGASFTEIAGLLSLSPNTVKSICHRSGIQIVRNGKTDSNICKNCGKPLTQISGKKKKTFCSTHCRTAWWNKNRIRKPYRLICYCCGKEFISFGNRKKKYCSPECYRLSRCSKDVP